MFSNKKRINISTIKKVLSFIWPDFIKTKDGLVFIAKKGNHYKENEHVRSINNKMDRTSIEAFYNHFHLEDVFFLKPSQELADIGKIIGNIWGVKLKKEFPNRCFRIYLIWEDGIHLRFHQIHNGEPYWLNDADWQEQILKGKIVIWNF